MQLVGRQLYDGYYVWSWPLPSAPDAMGHEFAAAEEKVGVLAIYEAADILLPFRDEEVAPRRPVTVVPEDGFLRDVPESEQERRQEAYEEAVRNADEIRGADGKD